MWVSSMQGKTVALILSNHKKVDSGCIIYSGAINSSGYGSIRICDKILGAHIVSYEHFKGPIPEGLHVLHTCNVRACINPDHLYVGTHAQNMQDKSKAGTVDNRGSKNPNAYMTVAKVRELRELSKTTGDNVLAEKYGIHKKTVGKIRRRKLWPEVI